jgi:2'-5' RNA ligase
MAAGWRVPAANRRRGQRCFRRDTVATDAFSTSEIRAAAAAQGLAQSALVVLVPESESVVGAWRAELDPDAQRGVPAHITLLYPFVTPTEIDEEIIRRCSDRVERRTAFEYELSEVRWFDPTIAYLAPALDRPFVDLTADLVDEFPDCPRYGGSVGEAIVPHVTIGVGGPDERMKAAADAVQSALPISAICSSVALLIGGLDDHSGRVALTFSLSEP